MGEPRTRHRQLPPHPASAGQARRWVGALLTRAGTEHLVEPAQLLVSEIVTNALVHAATSIDLRLTFAPDGLLVEVGDAGPHLPIPRDYSQTASTGMGLKLLAETADAWGVTHHLHGKRVWFRLGSGDGVARTSAATNGQAAAQRRPAVTTGDAVGVQLLNVPLLLHAAWHRHAETVLREYLLAALGQRASGESGAQALRVHAAAIDALTLLADHMPYPGVGPDPDHLMSTTVEPQASSAHIELAVPAASVGNFAVLEQTLESAVALTESHKMLNPPIQPELRSLRHWLCDQVALQSHGAAPTRWEAADEQPPRPLRVLTWDATSVTRSPDAVLAADDTDRIIAVSPAALELLGYDYSKQLVGQRVTVLIPPRYRQAHVAQLTLHLLAGRGQVPTTTVRVAALRRDGSELSVRVRVETHQAGHDRLVFVGTLQEP